MKKLSLLTGLIAMSMAIFLLIPKQVSAAPATFTVTNTNDSGAGSLRAAVEAANGNTNYGDEDVINFSIPGEGVHTINLESSLPEIVQSVFINGYSQPGSSANTSPSPEPMNSTIKIEINGNGNTDNVFTFGVPTFFEATSTVSGLSVYGGRLGAIRDHEFGYAGLHEVRVVGSFINVDASGLSMPNRDSDDRDKSGVSIFGRGGTIIGGDSPSERNIIASTGYFGHSSVVLARPAAGLKGNFIGIGRDGETDLGSKSGVEMDMWGSIVGSSNPESTNVISGNDITNIMIRGVEGAVWGNLIGTNYKGEVSSGITNGVGIALVHGASGNTIGGVGPGEGNTIAGVSGAGISMVLEPIPYSTSPAQWNAILGNSIHTIGTFDFPGFGTSNLGIDLNGPGISDLQGPNPNDPGDVDDGPNSMINYPVLKSAQQVGNQLTITYDLDVSGSPDNEYRVEFFASDSRSIFGYGPGEVFLGSDNLVSPGQDKTVTLSVDGDYSRKALSSTATVFGMYPGGTFIDVSDGPMTEYGPTSEFSRNILIASAGDSDADGIPDSIEDSAPNNGDGNNDGIPDRLQATVTSYVLSETNIYSTLVTDGCSENGRVSSVEIKTLNTKDKGYDYPFGLTDFTLNCSRGDTVDVELYIHATNEAEEYVPRKYNAENNTFSDIPGSVLSTETIGDSTALKLAYSIQDGGELDDDGEANGIIVDPVGIAVLSSTSSILDPGQLAKTGFTVVLPTILAITIILTAIYTFRDYKKHKKPLEQVDKEMNTNISKTYTYWHHIKVVSIPLAKYRLTVKLERKKTVGDRSVV